MLGSLLFILISVIAASVQRPERVFGDAREYRIAALAITEDRYPIAAEAPFVYRIGTPLLASVINPVVKRVISGPYDALIDSVTALDDVPPFYVINITATLLFAVLLLRYLEFFVASAKLRLLLLAMWLAQWHAPARWVYFNPVNVEPLFLLAILAGLFVIERRRMLPASRTAILLVPLTFAGTLCRESMVLLPLAFIASRQPAEIVFRRKWREAAIVAAPFVAAIAALAFTRIIASPTNAYDAWAEPMRMLRQKPIDSWLLAWFFTFGPAAIALMVSVAPELFRWLRQRQDMLVWLGGCGVLAFIGGSDTERILGWSVPVVYALLGVAIEQRRRELSGRPLLIGALVVVQLVSARLLWPVPTGYADPQPLRLALSFEGLSELADRVLVIRHHYANLWSFFGSRPLHLANLVVDVAFAAALAAWLRWRRATDAASG